MPDMRLVPFHVLVVLLWTPSFCAVVIDTQYGPVSGREIPVNNGRTNTTIHEFRGIPFAKEPTGPRRFMSPEAPDPWTEVLDATRPGDSCPQVRLGVLSASVPDWTRISENCLHLDIYSPDTSSAPGTYPVMVWLYGGAFQQGGSIQYPGHFLATHGVVVVVLNYRLGKFGFAYTASDAAPGNAGMWDQKMGLDFVINNIGNFGGDPEKITLFGESAGAASVALNMMSPQTKDSFQYAILESGSETNFWTINPPDSHPEQYIRQIADQLDCLDEDDYVMMDCLRELSMDNIISNSSISCAVGYNCLGMSPHVDGPEGFLPKTPAELREDGDIMKGPIMAGFLQDDGAFFIPLLVPETVFGCCNRSFFQKAVRERIMTNWLDQVDADTQEEVLAAVDWYYSQWPYVYENERNRDALVRMVTDFNFAADWDRQVKLHQEVADVFGFLFNYRSRNDTSPEWLGVKHADEIAYVWGFPMLQYNQQIWNESYLDPDMYFNEEDVQFSLYIQELFTNFAKYGDPTFIEVEKPNGGPTVWPKYDMENMEIIHMNREVEILSKYKQKDFAFVKEYLDFAFFGTPSEPQGKHDQTDLGVPGEFLAVMLNSIMFTSDPSQLEDFALSLLEYYNVYNK